MGSADFLAKVLDSKRLAALSSTRLVDTEPEEVFDGLTRLSSELLQAPVALVSLVDDRRQFFKSAVGLGEPWASGRETPLSHSFCKHVVATGKPLVVEDARLSPMLGENPAIKELGVIAYAGVPLEAAGEAIGAFCVIEQRPRVWSDADVRLLKGLGRAVEAQIALRVAHVALRERERMLDTVLDTVPAGVVLRDVDGGVVRTNRAIEKMLGLTASELAHTDFWAITHPDDVARDAASRQEILSGRRDVTTRFKRYRHADGHYIWVRLAAAALRDEHGIVQGTVAVIDDVTAELAAEEAVARQARIYQTIVHNIPKSAVLLFDREFRYLAADGPELLASVGLEKAALEGRTVRELARPEIVERVESLYRAVLAGESGQFETVRNGRTLLTRVAPVRDGNTVSAGIALVQDVTEEREQASAVRRAKALFEATLANIHDAVVVLDAGYNVVLANNAYCDLFGLSLDTVVGSTRAQFLAHAAPLAQDPEAFARSIEQPVAGALDKVADIVLVRPRRRTLRRTSTSIELPDGPGYLVVWKDTTAETALLEERERLALTDALTGIPNRRAAELALARAIAGAERGHTPLSVAIFDIDHFKRVNDRFGHATGDEVLRRVAACLDAARRLTDTAARWGGEEFLAVLPVSLDGAKAFCERVRQAVAGLACPGIGQVTISAGVASLTEKEGQERLLARADERLYAAKNAGRNRVEA